MSTAAVLTPIFANSSLITYAGDWNFTNYKPLTAGATASMNFTGELRDGAFGRFSPLISGSGVSIMGDGNFGLSSDNGGLTSVVDASSSAPGNRSILGTTSGSGSTGFNRYTLPSGAHTIDMVVGGTGLNFSFGGFSLRTNITAPWVFRLSSHC
jgi:hypothetical protein